MTAPVDTEAVRALARLAFLDAAGWVAGQEYRAPSGALLHDVLTEPEGCEVAERCLPAHAAFIAAASTMLPAAADELDTLRAELAAMTEARDEACRLLAKHAPEGSFARGRAGALGCVGDKP